MRGNYCLSKRVTRKITLPSLYRRDHGEIKVEESGQEEAIAKIQARDGTVLRLGDCSGDREKRTSSECILAAEQAALC